MARQRIFALMTLLQKQKYAEVLDLLSEDLNEGELLADASGVPWTEKRLLETMALYVAEHDRFLLDVEGRSLKHTLVEYSGDTMQIQQMLQDHMELNDWSIDFEIPLSASREAGSILLRLCRIGEVTS